MLIAGFLITAVAFLAYANGANDNFKGVATLFGTGTTDYRKALKLATVSTLLGSLVALFIGAALIKTFTGKGLVPDAVVGDPAFLLSVGFGAAATVIIATVVGLPVSTTHALTGALVGAGLAAPGGQLFFGALGNKFVYPLLASPFLALAVTILIYMVFRWGRKKLGISRETCLCVGEEVRVLGVEASPKQALSMSVTAVAAIERAQLTAAVGTKPECIQRYAGRFIGLDAQTVLDSSHFLSAGAVGFARGLNDTPKIVALLIGAQVLGVTSGTAIVGIAIAVGGILSVRKVAQTMSKEITEMTHGQGFTANLVTAFLVIVASRWGLPVSTTHVSCGSLFGIGLVSGTAKWRKIAIIFVAWVTTLPLAALVAGLVMALAA